MKIKIKFFSVLAAVLFFLLTGLQNAHAIEYGMLGGKPANPDPKVENSASWFIYQLKAGEAKQDAITIMNLFDTPLDVVVYAADSTPSSNGGFALKQLSESKDEVGAWVKFYPTAPPADFADIYQKHNENISEFCGLEQKKLQEEFGKKILTSDQLSGLAQWCQGVNLIDQQFKAKETLNIPFVFTVSESADTGEHTGGIMIQKKAVDDQPGQQGSTVKLTTRVGVRIYETVPGDIIKKLSLDNFQVLKNFQEFSFADWFGTKKPREYLVRTDISSGGNVSLEHENNVIITNLLFNKEPQTVERKFQVLKRDKFIANMAWAKPLFGHYSFQAQIKYPGTNGEETLLSAPVKIWIIPWREMTLALILAAILLSLYAAWRWRYKQKYGGIGWVEYAARKSDTIATLAEKYKVDWKVLVKTNKLKAPYLLEAGQRILVPGSGRPGKIGGDSFSPKGSLTDSLSAKQAGAVPAESEAIQKEWNAVEEEKTPMKDVLLESLAEAAVSAPVKKVPKKRAGKATAKQIDIERLMMKKRAKPEVLESRNVFLWNKAAWLVVGAVVVAIIGALVGFLVWQQKQIRVLNEKISVTAVGAPVASPAQETKPAETVQKNTEVVLSIGEMKISVLNEGATAGLAGKVREVLVAQGYAKTEAGNGEAEDVVGNFVYYSADKFKAEADKIKEFLATRNVKSEFLAAQTDEQKNADIVVILGK